jgi:voltage-gated potassium channel Kch
MKRDAEWFEDRELELIYIAKKLSDATTLEEHLTAAGIDYAVEPDEYQGGIIFRRTRIGAFFYVLPEALEAAQRVLRDRGFDRRGRLVQ